ncbi:MAG TPA: T9SS type A sorting domain-containing protein [Bacteroidales bacterium]|nr:T9SS type A sorting domain-containing protein [Bacteroidales bacterium]
MKKIAYFLILGLFILVLQSAQAQKVVTNKAINSRCYAGTRVNRIYVPPPKPFLKRSSSKGGANIKVYYTGFPDAAKVAFGFAVSILESVLPADVKMTIVANWAKIASDGTLGQTAVTGYVAGWGINALNPRAYYPVSLAEKIAGHTINEDSVGDLVLTINSSIRWYLGTDGATPSNNYDLVTVVLHEVCHGLGFYDSMNSNGTVAWWGVNSFPMIYDTFLEDQPGKKLTDTLAYMNYSQDLLTAITDDKVYFNGPLLSTYTSGQRAKIYAPSTFDPGSSISHLDENTTLEVNALMTPFIDLGEAIHDPGNYTMSILDDLGWVNTRITADTLKDTEAHLDQVKLSISVNSDTTYDRDRVGVVYSFDKFATSDTVFMTSAGTDSTWETAIAVPGYGSELQYYYYVTDYFSRVYRSPSLYDILKYSIYIGTDTVKPVITHTPALYYLQNVDTMDIRANAYDNLGLDTVYIEYRVNDEPSQYIGMNAGKNDNYDAVINARLLSLTGGDSVKYRIFAVDTAKVPNVAVLPDTGYFAISIEGISSVVDNYSTDFMDASADFFNIGFTVSRPASFSNYGLNSEHPYMSPEDNSKSINSIALLRHPVLFNESGMLITFNELVLVEPGESGTVYGYADFYDYVIVEGSADFGKTWFALAPGYDSREYPSWETAYNSRMSADGMNSTFVGTEDMLKKKSIYYKPSDKIAAGDTLMVRFRLYSDPYANGWGWVIENLKINPLVDAVNDVTTTPTVLYPNPGKGLINISSDNSAVRGGQLRYSVYNSAGICIVQNKLPDQDNAVIDITGQPPGMYIILLFRDNGIQQIKYFLVK